MTPDETAPPSDLRAEAALLGACLANPGALDDVADMINDRDFYRPSHRDIFAALVTMRDKGQPTDPVSLAHFLGDSLQRLGGAGYIHDLQASVVVGTNATYFAEIIVEHAMRRGLQDAGTRALQLARSEADDVADLIERARTSFDELTARTAANDELIEIGDLAESALARYASPAPPALPTGWLDLDASLSGGLWPGTLTVIGARPGQGKALALDTPVPTPEGWTTMGELRAGDYVFGLNGKPTRVDHAWPVCHDHPCFEVEFSDGEVIVADAEHQWLTETRASRRPMLAAARISPFSRDQRGKREFPSVKTTAEIAATVRTGSDCRANHCVPVAEALVLPHRDLPIDPYVMGYWLGDGSAAHAVLTCGAQDLDHVIGQLESAGYFYSINRTNTAYSLRFSTHQIRRGGSSGPSAVGSLRALGVLGCKHIPTAYLRASVEQRLALLAGLMDSDGTIGADGVAQFGVCDRRLADDVAELVRSLGFKVKRQVRRVKGRDEERSSCHRVIFRPHVDVFRIPRKAERVRMERRSTGDRRYIVDVRPVSSVPVRCITVDNDDHLYLAGRSMAPTHNSIAGGLIALNAALRGGTALFLSLEMTKAEITDRLISHLSGVRLWTITNHRLGSGEWDSVKHAADRLRGLPLAITDEPHMGVTGIRSRARDRIRAAGDLALIVIDQLNLIRPATARSKREEEVAELARSLKLLAKELNVPIVVLHQLNREPEKRGGKPQLSDLRESGMVEANADIAILLHPQPQDGPRNGEIDFIVAKNRQGPQGVITMAWQPHLARVGDLAKGGY